MFYNTKFEHSLEENEDGEVQRKNEESFLSLSLLCDKMKNMHGKVKSHNIYIVSCYYSINSIQTLLDSLDGRKVHIIISALGHSQEKIEEIIKDLKKIEIKKYMYVQNFHYFIQKYTMQKMKELMVQIVWLEVPI